MKPVGMIGVALIVFGLAALIYQGINYTSRETIINIGPIHATADTQKTIPLPPIVGTIAVVAGIVLLFNGARKEA